MAAGVAGAALFGLLNVSPIFAQSSAPDAAPLPSFEVASIKPTRPAGLGQFWNILPSRFNVNVTTKMLIAYAYNVSDFQVSGGPSWINSEEYDINARVEDSIAEKLQKLPWEQYKEQYGLMVQSLLADRFKLKVSHETKELPVYALVVAKNGPKLTLSTVPPPGPGQRRGPLFSMAWDHINAWGMSLAELAEKLSYIRGRKVLDQTGLKGEYDIALKWTPDQSPAGIVQVPDGAKLGTEAVISAESSGSSLFTAIQEQLGLKLESTKGPVDVLVIDHIERPSEN
jgi:uncharacterized protein (TIGR03435 family)